MHTLLPTIEQVLGQAAANRYIKALEGKLEPGENLQVLAEVATLMARMEPSEATSEALMTLARLLLPRAADYG